MIGVLFRHHVRLHRVPLVPLALGLALFEWIMTVVAREPSISRFLGEALRAAPPQFLALLNQDLVAIASPAGIVGLGYTHPFAAHHDGGVGRARAERVARRRDRPGHDGPRRGPAGGAWRPGRRLRTGAAGGPDGARARRLARHVRRTRRAPARRRHRVAVPAGRRRRCGCCSPSAGSVAIFVSALAREAGAAIAWSSGLLAGSYVLDYAARVWPRIASLRPLSLFRYYEPQQAMIAGLAVEDVGVRGGRRRGAAARLRRLLPPRSLAASSSSPLPPARPTSGTTCGTAMAPSPNRSHFLRSSNGVTPPTKAAGGPSTAIVRRSTGHHTVPRMPSRSSSRRARRDDERGRRCPGGSAGRSLPRRRGCTRG